MTEINCSIIPSEQLRNMESEYFKRLEEARVELNTEEKLKIHKMLFGLMDSVGGVREDVFEFFLNHNFKCAAQVMQCKDLFSRLADVGWFQLMFEEKSMKDTNAFPHWQEAIIRAFLTDVPLEQMKKMYEQAFVPIDLNRMISIYADKMQHRMEKIGEQIMKQGKCIHSEEEKEGISGVEQKEIIELLRNFEEEKTDILSRLNEEKETIVKEMQTILTSIQQMKDEVREYFAAQQHVSSMQHDVARPEEEVNMRHDVVKSKEETGMRHDVAKSKEEASMRHDVARPEEEAGMRHDVTKLEKETNDNISQIDTGIQTINIDEAREQQKQRLNVFALAYKKIKKNGFLAASENEKKSELFNMLTKKKSSKEYMITVNLLMKSGMDMGVIYDFIERNISLEELKSVLEAVNSEGEEKKQVSEKYIQAQRENEEDKEKPHNSIETQEILEEAAESFYMEDGEEDFDYL